MTIESASPLELAQAACDEHRQRLEEVAAKKAALAAIDAQLAALEERRLDADREYNEKQMGLDHIADSYFARLGELSQLKKVDQQELLAAITMLRLRLEGLDEADLAPLIAGVRMLMELPAGTPVVLRGYFDINTTGWCGRPLARPPYLVWAGMGGPRWNIRLELVRLENETPVKYTLPLDELTEDPYAVLAEHQIYVGQDRIVTAITELATTPQAPGTSYEPVRLAVTQAGLDASLCDVLDH